MKCRKCTETAVINMRQHKLALCADHFLAWIPEQTQRFIEKYKMLDYGHKLLLAVSGGKDSLALWDVLTRLGYHADGLYIGLGIDGGIDYSDRSYQVTRDFARARDLTLHYVDVEAVYGTGIPQAARIVRRGKKPCSVCGLSKRHIMNRFAYDGGYDVLLTGHNLDDEAAVLMQNTLNWAGGYLVRQAPVLPATRAGLVRKAKPFCRIYERETAAYAIVAGIHYVYDECPYALGAKSIYYKELLNKLEADRPGAKLQFYLSFLRAKQSGLFSTRSEDVAPGLNECDECGQPTTATGQCSFCRLWDRVRQVQQFQAAAD